MSNTLPKVEYCYPKVFELIFDNTEFLLDLAFESRHLATL